MHAEAADARRPSRPAKPSVTYLFRSGRRERIAEAHGFPSEFFYGFHQLAALGFEVHLAEDRDVGMAPPLSLPARLLNKFSGIAFDLPIGMAFSLLCEGGGRHLVGSDLVIATTSGMGMSLALAKLLGRAHVTVMFLTMGLFQRPPGRLKALIYRALGRHLHLVCISRGEQAFLQRLFPDRSVLYVPFGVDAAFWQPAAEGGEGRYILAIGNDPNRDWPTLVSTWSKELPPLKIVTGLPVPKAPENVEVIRGDWRERTLSDSEIRKLYQEALFVVVPVRETLQPSGQSACLQAMACGKAVIFSEISGLWDADLLRHGENVMLVRPGDIEALGVAVRQLVSDSRLRHSLATQARHLIETQLNVDVMAKALAEVIESLHAS